VTLGTVIEGLKVLGYQVADAVATITLDRPPMNTWTGRMHEEYCRCMVEAERDTAVRVVVVTGAGERAFCAGADARALEGHSERGAYEDGLPSDHARPATDAHPRYQHDFAFQLAMSKPIIAAINGAAAGVGLALACFADLRFATDTARMTTAHGRLGLPAEYGLSWMLPRLIGVTRAADLLLSSRIFSGEEAAAMGLVNESLAAVDLGKRVEDYASGLAERVSPASLAASKRQLYDDLHRDVGASLKEADRLLRQMMTTDDYREGVRAFVEKRSPVFGTGSRNG